MITYQQEFLTSVENECKDLIKEHWEEIALNKEHIKLNPCWETYYKLERENKLKIFTARSGETLVGYFVVVTGFNMHYKDHLFAENDILYLNKDYRKGWTGIKLIKFAEDCLKKDGVSVLKINTKKHYNFGLILDRLSFNHIEEVYTKYLGD